MERPRPNWKLHFGALWGGQAVSLFGSALVQFALVWWLTVTTRSATVLTTATLAAVLPGVLLAPLAGVLVDRLSRRRVMLAADAAVAAATLLLAYLFASEAVQVWHVYAILMARAAAGAFQEPAMTASTSLMVPGEHLARVAGFNESLRGGMGIVAPPAGALLLEALPMQGVLAVDVVTAVLGMLPLFFVHVPQPAPAATAESGPAQPSFWGELRAGLRYVRGWPALVTLLGMALFLNFLVSPGSSLIPLLVTEHFGGGVLQLASLDAVFGAGVIAGGLLLGVWGGFRRRIYTSLLGLVGLGAGFALLGLAPAGAFWLALASAAISSVMQVFVNGPVMAILQATIAPEMQGRVFSLIRAGSAAMMPLGLLLAGPLAEVLGVRTWFLIGGGACILMGGLGWFMPALLALEDRAAASAAPALAIEAAD
ncbi:MAG: MFS transporter [Anaerolineales bacterium]|nr:MFS transporter [Anaerolineales bacterium]